MTYSNSGGDSGLVVGSMDRHDNPQPGQYWSGGKNFRESYGGIIAAINDITVQNNQPIKKAYPENFGGIIEALMDLGAWLSGENVPGSDVDEKPPGSNIIIDIDGNITIEYPNGEPLLGTLWFDTRQGRLFVWDGTDWFQTNGADGLCHVETDPPDSPVVGDMWADTDDGSLFVFDGLSWVPVGGNTDAQTTATLPLAALMVGPATGDHSSLPDPNDYEFEFQNSFNIFLWQCLKALDTNLSKVLTTDDGKPPAVDEVPVSSLWFDPNDLTLSILHDDGDSVQWIPVHAGYDPAVVIREIDGKLNGEIQRRQRVEALLQSQAQSLEAEVETLKPLIAQVQALERGGGTSQDSLDQLEAALRVLIDGHSNALVDLMSKQSTLEMQRQTDHLQVQELIYKLAELKAELNPRKNLYIQQRLQNLEFADRALQNRVNDTVSSSEFERELSELSQLSQGQFSASGGVLSGGIQMDHNDIAEVGVDFSSSVVNSQNALKFTTFGGSDVTIGADESQQLSVQLGGTAEFAVASSAGKQLSVSNQGVMAKTLLIADFNPNNSDGVEAFNKIDVKEKLASYQQAFEGMRQALATADSFDEFKAELTSVLSGI